MFFDLFHKHYWGPPRRRDNGAYYMTCCECGKQRRLKVDIEDLKGQPISPNLESSKKAKAA